MTSSLKNKEHEIVKKILNKTFMSELDQEDKEFATSKLKYIYTEEMAKLLREKKYLLLVDKNKNQINEQQQKRKSEKSQRFKNLQIKSEERRVKCLNEKLKLYQSNEKRWMDKKEFIIKKHENEQKMLVQKAFQYRSKLDSEWKVKELTNKKFRRECSQRYHCLFNQTVSYRSPEEFNQQKDRKLKQIRKRNLTESRYNSTNLGQIIQKHQEKSNTIARERQNATFTKLISKLSKVQKHKKEQILKEQAKMQKSTASFRRQNTNKCEIGEQCVKFAKKLSGFDSRYQSRSKIHLSESKMRKSSQSNSREFLMRRYTQNVGSDHQQNFKTRGDLLKNLYKRSKQLKIVKLLKAKVRASIQDRMRYGNKSETIMT